MKKIDKSLVVVTSINVKLGKVPVWRRKQNRGLLRKGTKHSMEILEKSYFSDVSSMI